MGVTICVAKDGWYMTNGTGTNYPSQPFGEMADIMAPVTAYTKPMAAIILINSEICCEESRDMVPHI